MRKIKFILKKNIVKKFIFIIFIFFLIFDSQKLNANLNKNTIKNIFSDRSHGQQIYINLSESILDLKYQNFEDFIKLAIQKKYIAVNGQFFDCWNEGMASNYHWFNSLLKKSLNDNAPEYAIILNNFMITDRFQNFKSISLALGKGRKMPGAVVFFSRIGYEYFFPEFKKFGVPIICIVNSNESIKDIDFPLIGDNSLCSVNYFYLRIIRLALIKNFK